MLIKLKPELIEKGKQVAELLIVIGKERERVEAVKINVEEDEKVANNAAMEAKAIKVNRFGFFSYQIIKKLVVKGK